MPTSFQNMATLTYTGGTVNSNIVTGELREVLTAAKTAVRENYEPGGTVTYVVSLTNSGVTPLTGLTISDNLGGYTFGGATLYPLAYVPGSVRYYVNGALQAAPAVNAGPPMTVTGITVSAGGSALVIYETEVTRYAPLAAESSIVNTVTVTGGGLAAPVTAEETVGAVSSPRLSITKGLNPTVVAENGRITYTFTIQNTTREMSRKLMMALMRVPMGKIPTVTLSNSVCPLIRVMMGLIMASTMPLTIAVKAPPMTTPTARSMTLPREMKSLNSLIQEGFFISIFLFLSF